MNRASFFRSLGLGALAAPALVKAIADRPTDTLTLDGKTIAEWPVPVKTANDVWLDDYCAKHGLSECNIHSMIVTKPVSLMEPDEIGFVGREIAQAYYWQAPGPRGKLSINVPWHESGALDQLADAINSVRFIKVEPKYDVHNRFGTEAYVLVDTWDFHPEGQPVLAFVILPDSARVDRLPRGVTRIIGANPMRFEFES